MKSARGLAWMVAVFAGVLGCAACAPMSGGPARGPAGDRELALLADWMSGTFSSARQAEADSSYYEIILRMAPIWPARSDGHWLYVEQAVAGFEHRPYRQRIYHLTRTGPDRFQSAVFALPDPERFIGAWRQPRYFGTLAPEELIAREGCAIALRRRSDGAFVGSTLGRACQSDLRGASYATAEVVITADGMTSWDRGFDAAGRQVWGAEQGGYVFDKLSNR